MAQHLGVAFRASLAIDCSTFGRGWGQGGPVQGVCQFGYFAAIVGKRFVASFAYFIFLAGHCNLLGIC